jgi:hypothetical protein
MQLPEKNKEYFDVSSEGFLSAVLNLILLTPDKEPALDTSTFSLYFSSSCIPTNERLLQGFRSYYIFENLPSGFCITERCEFMLLTYGNTARHSIGHARLLVLSFGTVCLSEFKL